MAHYHGADEWTTTFPILLCCPRTRALAAGRDRPHGDLSKIGVALMSLNGQRAATHVRTNRSVCRAGVAGRTMADRFAMRYRAPRHGLNRRRSGCRRVPRPREVAQLRAHQAAAEIESLHLRMGRQDQAAGLSPAAIRHCAMIRRRERPRPRFGSTRLPHPHVTTPRPLPSHRRWKRSRAAGVAHKSDPAGAGCASQELIESTGRAPQNIRGALSATFEGSLHFVLARRQRCLTPIL